MQILYDGYFLVLNNFAFRDYELKFDSTENMIRFLKTNEKDFNIDIENEVKKIRYNYKYEEIDIIADGNIIHTIKNNDSVYNINKELYNCMLRAPELKEITANRINIYGCEEYTAVGNIDEIFISENYGKMYLNMDFQIIGENRTKYFDGEDRYEKEPWYKRIFKL